VDHNSPAKPATSAASARSGSEGSLPSEEKQLWGFGHAGQAPASDFSRSLLIFRMILALPSATSLTLYQGKLTEKAGLSRNALGLIEQDRRWPRIANVLRISDGLGMTIEDVLKGIQKKRGTADPGRN